MWIDGWCKTEGQAVAAIAYAIACHKLKVMCHVKDLTNSNNDEGDKDKDKIEIPKSMCHSRVLCQSHHVI